MKADRLILVSWRACLTDVQLSIIFWTCSQPPMLACDLYIHLRHVVRWPHHECLLNSAWSTIQRERVGGSYFPFKTSEKIQTIFFLVLSGASGNQGCNCVNARDVTMGLFWFAEDIDRRCFNTRQKSVCLQLLPVLSALMKSIWLLLIVHLTLTCRQQ